MFIKMSYLSNSNNVPKMYMFSRKDAKRAKKNRIHDLPFATFAGSARDAFDFIIH
jgi:hypothetical protein